MRNWIGKTIVSQYGLVCDVTKAEEVDGKIRVTCRSNYNDKVWEWDVDTISLVTKAGEILDVEDGEIYGRVVGDIWHLYGDEKCRKISQEMIDVEFV